MKKVFSVLFLSLFTFSFSHAAISDADVIAKAKIYDMNCNDYGDGPTIYVEHFVQKFKRVYQDQEEQVDYFLASCTAGAYNGSSILFMVEQEQLVPIPLSIPLFNAENEVLGFYSSIVHPELLYSEEEKSLVSFAKWRGVGDASSSGIYVFFQGEIILRSYSVDSTYDGEYNPLVIYESKVPLNSN